MTMLAEGVEVVIGVDTHRDTHTAAAVVAATGAAIEHATVCARPEGYAELVALADRCSQSRAWSVEGTGSYGRGLTRLLAELGELVIEIERPVRAARRSGAKSDPIDAVRAAREALTREHLASPRAEGPRAVVAVRMTARRSAVEAHTITQRQLQSLVTTAPERLRTRFVGKATKVVVAAAARLRVDARWDLETRHHAAVMRDVARRCLALQAEAKGHEDAIREVITNWRPDLLQTRGVGPIVAADVLCAWSHPGRCRSDAAFASLAGVAPLEASSGLTTRHRLSRRGDRQLNRALHVVAMSRLLYDPETQSYAQRRRAEGKTDREIKRCLKRYIARQLFRQLETHPPPLDDL
jgi:transposase